MGSLRLHRRVLFLLLPLVVMALFVPQGGASSWAYLNYTQDFVDATSDLHTPSDKGSHNVFADLQDYGSNYDTMTEVDTSSSTNINDFSDSSSSNVDSHAGHGTLTNYANMQDGDDGDYASMAEADTDTGTANIGDSSGSGTSYVTVAVDTGYWGVYTSSSHSGEVTGVSFYGRGASTTINVKSVICVDGVIVANGVSNALSVSTTAGTKTTVYSAGSRPKLENGGTYWIGVIPSGSLRLYYDSTTGGTSYYDSTNSYTTPSDPAGSSSGTYTWRLMYAVQPYLEYEEDQEIQFTSVDYDETNEYLCIQTGTPFPATENLKVDVWYSSTWNNLCTMTTANTWYNYSVASYLDSSTFTFRFVDDDATDDTTQSTWYIDTALLHCWTTATANYELDLEVGWTSADYDEGNEYLCIYPVTGGGWPSEDILVKVWSSSWVTVFSDLTPDTWNNVSIASYLVDATLEVQFLGGTESGDTTQSTWTIDAVLIRTYSFTYTETVSETLGLDDSVLTAVTAVFSYFETISLDEAVNTAVSFSTIISEVISLSASVGVAASLVVNLFEQITLSGTVTTVATYAITVFETLGLVVSAEMNKYAVIVVYETIASSASVSTSCVFSSLLNEVLQLSDTWTVPGASIIYRIYIYEVVNVLAGIPTLTSYRPSIFYDLFLSTEIWGYLGPLALVIIGFFITKKERDLGIFFIIVDSLIIYTYLTLVAETPLYWWHIFILILGVIQCTFRLIDR